MSVRYARVKHFRDRCLERGIREENIRDLYVGIPWAIKNERHDLVEKVLVEKGVTYYRFRCPDGIFYALVKDGKTSPSTIYTQKMFKNRRRVAKFRKRRHLKKEARQECQTLDLVD